MAKFVISGPDGKQTSYELLSKETRIGRVAPMVDIVVNDGRASRLHAVVRRLQSGFTLVDLNSANGTFVNEKRIKEQLLREGDVVRIGETTLAFQASRPATAPIVEQVAGEIPKSKTVMLVHSDSFRVARSEKTVTPDEVARLRTKAEILSHMFDLSKTLASVFDMDEICRGETYWPMLAWSSTGRLSYCRRWRATSLRSMRRSASGVCASTVTVRATAICSTMSESGPNSLMTSRALLTISIQKIKFPEET